MVPLPDKANPYKLNACVGYIVQVVLLLAKYLDVLLPFRMVFAGSMSHIGSVCT